MKCKYDEAHGEFNGPIALGKHYEDEHADRYTKKVQAKSPSIYRCNYCSREYSWPADIRKHILRAHLDKVHGAYLSDEHSTKRSRGSSQELVPLRAKPKPKPQPVIDLHVDDIVVNVVAAMANPSKMIAIDKLPAIFEWRDATEKMLNATRNGIV